MSSDAPSLRAGSIARLPAAQLLKFGVVGIGATLTHALVLSLAVELANADEVLANGAAFLVAVVVTYLGQSLWVFRATDHSAARIRNFLIVAATGFVANVSVMACAVRLLDFHYLVGFSTATILIPTATFVANKFWVFAEQNRRDEPLRKKTDVA